MHSNLIYICCVKRNIRVLSAITLVAVYCLTFGVLANANEYSDFLEKQSPQESYFSDSSTKLFAHTIQYESLANGYNSPPAISLKKSLNKHLAISKTTEQLFDQSFSQYTSLAINILIHHRKSNLIFPFHYFW